MSGMSSWSDGTRAWQRSSLVASESQEKLFRGLLCMHSSAHLTSGCVKREPTKLNLRSGPLQKKFGDPVLENTKLTEYFPVYNKAMETIYWNVNFIMAFCQLFYCFMLIPGTLPGP